LRDSEPVYKHRSIMERGDYEYSTRLLSMGPPVHRRRLLPDGEWEEYQPDFSHVTPAMKEEFRKLAREHHLKRMKTDGRIH